MRPITMTRFDQGRDELGVSEIVYTIYLLPFDGEKDDNREYPIFGQSQFDEESKSKSQ